MGYYSDVMIATTKKGYEEFEKYMSRENEDGYLSIGGYGFTHEEAWDDYIVFGWSCVKWYEKLPEVQTIMEGLEYIGAANEPWQFIRVGEDYGDVEETHSVSDRQVDVLFVQTRIEW